MRAIDIHIHVPEPPEAHGSLEKQSMAGYFKAGQMPQSPEEMYEKYKSLEIFGVIFSIDAETRSGGRYVGNDYVAEVVRKYPDQFLGFASVDPWKGALAVRELERAVKELGLRGLKLHPTTQAFFPNDQRFYPLWEKCAELQVPLLSHTGQTGVGAGTPGGAGLKLKYAHPLHLDDVAADFPDLTIIMAHPAVPWQEEQLAIAMHKANVYIDLSGWSPKYFRPVLVQYANSLLQDKVLFGSDYPVLQPERWLKDFEALELKEEVRRKILLENAKKLLKL
ncbi:MAG TPA: amidohydrolase family protein [Blastocatellia bacterium]|nr:amidohydrolase family protein [Blastocatellia bacterium]